MVSLTFLGATGTVTGSRYLVEVHGTRILIDAGLFQEKKELRLRNWAPFPLPPASLAAVILTHAHIDHTGFLPRLVGEGFRGPTFATPPTTRLLRVVLPDAAHLQEEEARFANKVGSSKHTPALPLFTVRDAQEAMTTLDSPMAREATVAYRSCAIEHDAEMRALVREGEVKIFGEMIPVPAQIRSIPSLSAHADADELTIWANEPATAPKEVFVTHGEPEASQALADRFAGRFGWCCVLPAIEETVTL